jgi:hypothetical protein
MDRSWIWVLLAWTVRRADGDDMVGDGERATEERKPLISDALKRA